VAAASRRLSPPCGDAAAKSRGGGGHKAAKRRRKRQFPAALRPAELPQDAAAMRLWPPLAALDFAAYRHKIVAA